MCPSCGEDRLTTISSHCEDSSTVITANPVAVHREKEMDTVTVEAKPGRSYLLVVIRQLLLMSGDVELNPGPLDGECRVV
jgi:hypothetical protein